jgi:DNA-3-methyladenine glycosylase I
VTGQPPAVSDAVVGDDGIPRCPWAGPSGTPLARYHDEIWATPTDDESALFEALTLGVFQVGLSWRVVFGKRDAFRRAFHGFDVAKVSVMADKQVGELLQDPTIIRNRAKIEATITNARVMRSSSPSLAQLTAAYTIDRRPAPRGVADVPTTTVEAEGFAAQLKSQGYRFVGPTSVYAFMQNVGIVNDHIRGCFRASDYRPAA